MFAVYKYNHNTKSWVLKGVNNFSNKTEAKEKTSREFKTDKKDILVKTFFKTNNSTIFTTNKKMLDKIKKRI
jgi:hypothetical protein